MIQHRGPYRPPAVYFLMIPLHLTSHLIGLDCVLVLLCSNPLITVLNRNDITYLTYCHYLEATHMLHKLHRFISLVLNTKN